MQYVDFILLLIVRFWIAEQHPGLRMFEIWYTPRLQIVTAVEVVRYSRINPKPSTVACNFPALEASHQSLRTLWCAARETFALDTVNEVNVSRVATLTAPNAAACCSLDCRKIPAPQ